jgi:phosphatidylglycerophosphate synthase
MLQRKLRPWVEMNIYDPSARLIARLGISPNVVSAGVLLLAPIACYLIVMRSYALAMAFVILSGVVDSIDGCVARAMNRVTKFGTYWDAMLDRYVDCILYLGFLLDGFVLATFAATCGTLLTSYAKPRTAITADLFAYDWPTIGERGDRFVLLIVGLLTASIAPTLGGVSTIRIMLWAIAIMTNVGAIQRMVYTYRHLEHGKAEGSRAHSRVT